VKTSDKTVAAMITDLDTPPLDAEEDAAEVLTGKTGVAAEG